MLRPNNLTSRTSSRSYLNISINSSTSTMPSSMRIMFNSFSNNTTRPSSATMAPIWITSQLTWNGPRCQLRNSSNGLLLTIFSPLHSDQASLVTAITTALAMVTVTVLVSLRPTCQADTIPVVPSKRSDNFGDHQGRHVCLAGVLQFASFSG